MDPKLRGELENFIDSLIEIETLNAYYEEMATNFPVDAKCFLFGFVIGDTWHHFIDSIGAEEASLEDKIKKFIGIIEDRTMKIRNNIKLATER